MQVDRSLTVVQSSNLKRVTPRQVERLVERATGRGGTADFD
jgi:hypothetical protein